ncbi:MAG: hypothetical protein SFU98_06850 [Leptospiraceae bacterium]|nr:hypothetical protein [Leptospiraceae bacterium]
MLKNKLEKVDSPTLCAGEVPLYSNFSTTLINFSKYNLVLLLAIFLLSVTCKSPNIFNLQLPNVDTEDLRKPFVSLCAYSHLLGDNYDRELEVVPCPEKIMRQSEWFGLSGPVSSVSEGIATIHFDKTGKLDSVTNGYHSVSISNFVHEKNTITFLGGSFQIVTDDQGRIVEWTKRCMEDCRILQGTPHANGKERYISFPVGTLLDRTRYTYSKKQIVISHEEFDYIGATAKKPGPQFRLITDIYRITDNNVLKMERKDRIGRVGNSKVFPYQKEWNLTHLMHRTTFHLPDPKFMGNGTTTELPVKIDSYGNWVEWGPGSNQNSKLQRKINYY